RRDPDLVLDARKYRILRVRGFLVAEVHPRVQADVDATRDDPERDVRCLHPAIEKRHTAWLDRVEAEHAIVHSGWASSPPSEVRISRSPHFRRRIVKPSSI